MGPSFSSGPKNGDDHKSYVALVRLNGIIMPNSDFSAKAVIPELTRAFKDKDAKGVVLLINSPGGSPVQASMIHDKIIQLKTKYHKEVIVVGEDTLASGAYLVSTAADKIL
jgi:Periplasmic serine proteases (ClpP class)